MIEHTQNSDLNQWLLDLLDWDDPKVVSIRADWAKCQLDKNKDKRGFAQAVLTKCNQCLQMHIAETITD